MVPPHSSRPGLGSIFCLIFLLQIHAANSAPASGEISNRSWQAAADKPYLQEIGEKILTDKPVRSLGLISNTLCAVVGETVKRLVNGTLQDWPAAPQNISRLRSLAGALWALTPQGVYRSSGHDWEQVDTRAFTDLCLHLGEVHGATRDELFRLENGRLISTRPKDGYLSTDSTMVMEDFSQLLADPVQIGPVARIVSYSGTLYVLRPGSLALIDGKTFATDTLDWGKLPSPVTRDMLAQGSKLYIATDRGVAVLRGMSMTSWGGTDGLPFEDTTCLAPGFDGDLWIGTSRGAIRKVGDDYHFFGAHHWLPGEQVHAIVVGERTVYIGTDGGLAIIRYEPLTLAKKAAFFERELDLWGMKRLGFIHKLYWAEDQKAWLREISDNDGGHTAHYLAAMSFKYAATGDEQARKEAVEAFRAMAWLQDVTTNGYIARAIWSTKGDPGERSTRGSGGLPAKWYPTADGAWFWKGDTSSDEVSAHMYAVSVFHDLAAKGAERDRARAQISKLASHIIDNGWVLRDPDGKPTRWGRWDPQYLLRAYGFEARGLNGMEAQTYMHAALALTGDEKFKQGLEQLLQWRYHTYTVRQRVTFPPDQVAPWDDELAFFCYYTLLRYAKDPELRSIYLRSLERSWEILRVHQIPFFNFVYGGLTGNDCEIPQAIRHLREWSLDLVNHNYRNSHRADLATPKNYLVYGADRRAISPRETEAKWGDRYPLQLDGGEGGQGVTPPVGWLEDYWLGRYYGMIAAPEETSVSPPSAARRGAAAYAGPARPN